MFFKNSKFDLLTREYTGIIDWRDKKIGDLVSTKFKIQFNEDFSEIESFSR